MLHIRIEGLPHSWGCIIHPYGKVCRAGFQMVLLRRKISCVSSLPKQHLLGTVSFSHQKHHQNLEFALRLLFQPQFYYFYFKLPTHTVNYKPLQNIVAHRNTTNSNCSTKQPRVQQERAEKTDSCRSLVMCKN